MTRWIVLFSLVVIAVLHCVFLYLLISADTLFLWRDIDQDYLMVRALVAGDNPYLPIVELSKRYGMEGVSHTLRNPSPHPPTILPWLIPFSILSRQTVGILWFGISLLAAYYSCFLSIRIFAPKLRQQFFYALLLFSIVVQTAPAHDDLQLGQFSFIQLVFLLLAYERYLRKEKFLSGILFGLLASIKLFLLPLLILFAIKRERQVLLGGALAICLQICLFMLFLKMEYLSTYLALSISGTLNDFLLMTHNYTITSMLSSIFHNYMLNSPHTALLPLLLATADFLIWGVFFALVMLRCMSCRIETAIWRVVAASIILSPIAWCHYTVLLLPAVFFLATQIKERPEEGPPVIWQLALLAPIFLPNVLSALPLWNMFKDTLGATGMNTETFNRNPFWIIALSRIPVLLIGSFALLYNPTYRQHANQELENV